MTDETALDEAETRFQQALAANDTDGLDRLLHEAAHYTGPDGVTIDKAADMAAHRSGALRVVRLEQLERQVQVVGGTGITRAVLHVVGVVGDHDLDVTVAYTRTWVRTDDGWLVAAAHGSVHAPH